MNGPRRKQSDRIFSTDFFFGKTPEILHQGIQAKKIILNIGS